MFFKDYNDLLDEILMNRINKVGYKTRAGVKIDEKGRYYHTGLFLDESRYNNTSMRKNGFDCSGFISWMILYGILD